jgi:hypothetical protein
MLMTLLSGLSLEEKKLTTAQFAQNAMEKSVQIAMLKKGIQRVM